MRKNYYQVLGVLQNAKQIDIDAAYVELKAKFQGLYDQGNQSASEELFNLRAAYETLSIPEKRSAYDEKLAAMQFQPQPIQKHTPQPKSPQDHNKAPKLIECSVCGKQMSSGAATCPHCGEKNPNAKSQGSILGITSVGLGIGSVLMPYFAAVFLVPATIICGVIAIKNDQKRLGKIAVALGFIGLAGVIYTSSQITKLTSAMGGKFGDISLPQSIREESPIVTRSEYEQIQEGMSYSEVRSIIGAAGEEISRSDIVSISTVMYSWTNSNGSNMNAMFQNDHLVNKAQFGLP